MIKLQSKVDPLKIIELKENSHEILSGWLEPLEYYDKKFWKEVKETKE